MAVTLGTFYPCTHEVRVYSVVVTVRPDLAARARDVRGRLRDVKQIEEAVLEGLPQRVQ